MRDDQMRRYARHILLPEIGGVGQRALMAARAAVAHGDAAHVDHAAARWAVRYLAAGGVGVIQFAGASAAACADLSGYALEAAVEATVATPTDARDVGRAPDDDAVALPARPEWWPGADDDATSLACWRGAMASTTWMATRATRRP